MMDTERTLPGLSRRAGSLAASQTVAITTRAQEMKAAGTDVISLSAGEPDFDTPAHIRQAGIDAINAGFTRYMPATGDPELKQAVCGHFASRHGLVYEPSQICITNGGKQAIFNAVCALLDEDDEVIIPAPYWVTYPEVIKLAGARAVTVPADESTGFKMTAAQLAASITPQTKMLILNSPGNPSGAVYGKDELAALAAVVEKHALWVLTDEIYDILTYDGRTQTSLATLPGMQERCLVANGASKAFAMTGWRVGWLAAPPTVAAAVARIQSQITHHPCSIAQRAALAALQGPADYLAGWLEAFTERRNLVVKRLNAMPGITCAEPEGAFYVFPNIQELLGRNVGGITITDSAAFCAYLLEKAHVAVVPGSAFGAEGYFRISYAASLDTLTAAMDRIEKAIL